MPIYEFRCENCGHRFSLLVGVNDRDKVTCPRCRSRDVQQLVTSCGVRSGREAGCGWPASGFRIKGG